jgi:hypothetical protein
MTKPRLLTMPKYSSLEMESAIRKAEAAARREEYLKALDASSAVVRKEFDRWLSDDNSQYPEFDTIFDGIDQLKSDYLKEENDGKDK